MFVNNMLKGDVASMIRERRTPLRHGTGQTNDGNDQGCGRERERGVGYGLPASFDEI
jgi:hypothetical protein